MLKVNKIDWITIYLLQKKFAKYTYELVVYKIKLKITFIIITYNNIKTNTMSRGDYRTIDFAQGSRGQLWRSTVWSGQ